MGQESYPKVPFPIELKLNVKLALFEHKLNVKLALLFQTRAPPPVRDHHRPTKITTNLDPLYKRARAWMIAVYQER